MKKEQLLNDGAFLAVKLLLEELSKKHEANLAEILAEIKNSDGKKIKSESIETDLQNQKEKNQKEDFEDPLLKIPITLFENNAGYLELICAYSKDVLKLGFSEIAKKINRDPRTIWTSYTKCKQNSEILSVEKTEKFIPLQIFSNRQLSTFECLINFLSKTHKTKEIATLLKIDYKTVWTAKTRAEEKLK